MMTHFEILANADIGDSGGDGDHDHDAESGDVVVVVVVVVSSVGLSIHSHLTQVQGYKVSELLDTSQLKQWSRV